MSRPTIYHPRRRNPNADPGPWPEPPPRTQAETDALNAAHAQVQREQEAFNARRAAGEVVERQVLTPIRDND